MTLRSYLAKNPAADDEINLIADLDAGFFSVAPTRQARVLPIILGVFFGGFFIVILGAKLVEGLQGAELFGMGVVAVILTFLGWPMLRKRLSGGATWAREAKLDGDTLIVTDRFSGTTETWRAPLSEFNGIGHRVTSSSGVQSNGIGVQTVLYDVLELSHPDAGRTIPLWKKPQTTSGGMGALDMISAAREGRRTELEAALNSRDNPALRRFATRSAAKLGVPLDNTVPSE